MSRVRDLIDGQTSRTLLSRGTQGAMSLVSASFEPTLNGASVSVAGAIPDRSLVVAATVYVNAALTGGMTSFSVGYTGATSAFGSGIAIAAGSSNIGVIGPQPFYAATDLVLTAAGGTGSSNAGKIRVVLYYLSWATPTA